MAPDRGSTPPKREWSPRIWQGMEFGGWLRLLRRNRFAVGPRQLHIAVVLTLVTPLHTLLRAVQFLTHGRGVARTQLREPPLFVVGHWRSGTTFLHELLAADGRHTAPTTYQCFVPNHFLLTERIGRRLLRPLLPGRRPMDDMAVGWERPQEDEFALCNLGLRSPYLEIAFPNRGVRDVEYRTLEQVAPRARERWRRTYLRFLRQITLRDPRRLVLKSPLHTFRLGLLAELFPDARFVHLVRHPYDLFPSTVHLWRSLFRRHGLQRPRFRDLEERVLETLVQMYEAFERQRGRLALSRLHELRYEDLCADPVARLRELYRRLDLGDFEPARPAVEAHLDQVAGHRRNVYRLTPERRAEIARRWGFLFERYGYEP